MQKAIYGLQIVFPIICGFVALSCVSQGPTNAPSNFFSSDPVARANGSGVSFSTNGQFDVGVAFSRTDTRGSQLTASAAMAFDKDWIPAKANVAVVNDISLPWLGGGSGDFLPNTFGLKDSSLLGSPDSVSFGYSNFDNDYYGNIVPAAQSFGTVTAPDTVSASQGFTFKYSNSFPSNTIQVSLEAFDSLSTDSALVVENFSAPDTGAVTFLPQNIPFTKGGTYYYAVQLLREQFVSLTSGNGKRIGIYSNYITGAGFSVKP